ncbi:MAG: hypothetical protein RL612_628 [Actinomycetota bacterium]|jgi:hypothetical protein
MSILKWLRKSAKIGGAFSVFNEIYQPHAHSTQIIVEEQKQAIKPKPSPEDKEKKNPAN